MKTKPTVLIVGGGPVGLLIALRLGQAGIDTLIIEKHPTFQPATRAMVYMYRFENLKIREIARLHAISPSAVEKHVAKALVHLTRRLPCARW